MINPRMKKIEIKIEKSVGKEILNFRLFGKEENRAVAVTHDGFLVLYSLHYGLKRGVLSYHHEELIPDREETPISIADWPKNQLILLEIESNHYQIVCSRMIILELTEDKFTKKASIDQYNQRIGYKYSLEPYKYIGSHILWLGLSMDMNRIVQVLDYDTKTGVLRELEEKRTGHQECDPMQLVPLDKNKFYYTGNYGKEMNLIVNI